MPLKIPVTLEGFQSETITEMNIEIAIGWQMKQIRKIYFVLQ